jgi:hypothetical protein
MIPLPLLDGDTLLLDNSSLETFTTCPRSAQYLVCEKRKSSTERSALKFGGIIHQALELRYLAASSMYAQTDEVQSVMMARLSKEFSTWQPPEEDFRTYTCATELIRLYGETYPFESFQVLKDSTGRPFVEMPFAVPIGQIDINDRIWVKPMAKNVDGVVCQSAPLEERFVSTINLIWTGKIDLAYSLDGRNFILDHKTTSIMGPSYFTSFEDSHQLIGYSWAAEHLLGVPIHGFVVNAIGVRKPTKTGKAFEFIRKAFSVDKWQKDEWVSDTMHIVSDFIEMCRRGYLPKHRAWCVGKFGECQFRKVCTLPPEQRQIMLSTGEYEDATWSPLNANA